MVLARAAIVLTSWQHLQPLLLVEAHWNSEAGCQAGQQMMYRLVACLQQALLPSALSHSLGLLSREPSSIQVASLFLRTLGAQS